MKVLLAITKSNFGGAQRYVYDLALASRTAGHETAVLCGGTGLLAERLREEGIRVIPLPSMQRNVHLTEDYKSFFFIYHLLKREKPDVFHVNSSKVGGLGTLAARLTSIPHILFTAHGWAFNEDRSEIEQVAIRLFTWFTILLSHTTICVSERLKKDFNYWPLVEEKLVVIHNGIENFPLLSRSEARSRLASDALGSTLLIGATAELHHTKALDAAIKAIAENFKGTDTRLLILGEGEERKDLESLAAEQGVTSQITFEGFVKEARGLLSGLDIFILPSRTEGLPYALLEAGIASLPVVASRIGGIPEVVEDGVSGFLIPAANPYFLGKALQELAESPEKRLRFGQALHQTVATKFNKEAMLATTLALYEPMPNGALASIA